jgi:iron complex transport system substrate-binding protein
MKILSLLPSATEIVFALGLGGHLEGVTHECDFPAEARHKRVVSTTALPTGQPLRAGDINRVVGEFMDRREPIYQLDKELIQGIQPDFILAQDLCRVCAVPSGQVEDALAELGCSAEVVSLDPTTIGDILDGIVMVGRATGQESRAQELVSGLRQRVERVRVACTGLLSVRTLALEWSDPPFVAGHWIPGMVKLAGGVNLLSGDREPSRRVRWAEIAAASPELIVFMPCGYSLEQAKTEAEALFDVPDFSSTPAAARGDVFAVDASSYFSRPGPRIVDGLEVLAWAIHPKRFPEPPTGRIARVKP